MADTLKTDETLPDIAAKDVEAAKIAGVKDAIAESAKAQFKATDGISVTSDPYPGIVPDYNVFQLQDLVDLEPDALKDRLDGKTGPAPSLGQAAALLEVERSGKNRTDIVDVFCKHLGIKAPYEVTDAGPNYTNDVSRKLIQR